EERLGICLRAQRAVLPACFFDVSVEKKEFSHGSRPFDPVLHHLPQVALRGPGP
ncbi:MAG: hypothetical protein JWN22_2030, partial [Nocardioides sp.]|nr:hypothetical protein [Nocardioides sp.]